MDEVPSIREDFNNFTATIEKMKANMWLSQMVAKSDWNQKKKMGAGLWGADVLFD